MNVSVVKSYDPDLFTHRYVDGGYSDDDVASEYDEDYLPEDVESESEEVSMSEDDFALQKNSSPLQRILTRSRSMKHEKSGKQINERTRVYDTRSRKRNRESTETPKHKSSKGPDPKPKKLKVISKFTTNVEKSDWQPLCSKVLRKGDHKNNISSVIGRDDEVETITTMLAQQQGGLRPLLIGPAGIGKKAIVRKFSHDIFGDHIPESLRNRTVVMINCKELVGKHITAWKKSGPGATLFQIFQAAIKEEENPIFYLRDIDDVYDYEYAAEFLQSLFRHPISFIASVSGNAKDERVINTIKALSNYHFEPIYVKECSKEEATQIVKKKLKKRPLLSEMVASEESINLAVTLSKKYIPERFLPMKAEQLIKQAANDIFYISRKNDYPPPKELSPMHIAKIMSKRTGHSPEQLVSSDIKNLLMIKERIMKQLIAQNEAVERVMNSLIIYRKQFNTTKRPWGIFLFVGPTGVGKTELAKLLAREQYHNDKGILRIDMGTYSEPQSLSRLIGSSPGYVGYDEGGQLCNALRTTPECVVLLDEIEKAHPEVLKIFLSVFDDAVITDGKGVKVDCSKACFIMTSNLGAKKMQELSARGNLDIKTVLREVEVELKKHFKPEFLGRIKDDVVPFQSIPTNEHPKVVAVHLNKFHDFFAKEHSIQLSWSENVVSYFLKNYEVNAYGVRPLCTGIQKEVGTALVAASIKYNLDKGSKVRIDVKMSKLIAQPIG